MHKKFLVWVVPAVALRVTTAETKSPLEKSLPNLQAL
jgi:hypothetical protein